MLLLLAATDLVWAQSLWVDACEVDYFSEETGCRREAPEPPEAAEEDPASPEATKKKSLREWDAEPFDWAAYQDPRDVRFWDDGGDWVPPRPLREVLADPTPENLERYRAWVDQKLEVSRVGHELLWGAAPQRGAVPEVKVGQSPKVPRVAWDRVSILYFYQSTCPHCRKSKPLVANLKARGVEVIPVYLDREDPDYGESIPYSRELAERVEVAGTPTWLVSVYGRQTVVRGATTMERLGKVVRYLEEEGETR